MKKISVFVLAIIMALTSVVTVFADGESCPHNNTEWKTVTAATCTTNGKKALVCLDCSDELDTGVIDALGHSWSDWKIVKAATILKTGVQSRTCTRCNEVQNASIAKIKAWVKLSKKSIVIMKGKSKKLKATYAKGDKIKSWKSSNKSVATVNKKGVVKAKRSGKATITVVTKAGKKAKCKIKVKTPAKKKTTSKKSSSRASTRAAGGGIVYWTPSGDVYHSTRGCRSLARSRTVYSGTISQSGKSRPCRNCH